MYIKDKDGNYVPAPIIRGNDGREISLRATDTHIQWKYDDTEWTNLVALSELKGKQGDKGTVGAHFTPSVSDDGVLSWTNNGELENPQPVNIRGPQGVQGEQGRGFTILGYYDTLAILQSSVLAPNGGDAYGVGTTPPYDIYIWDAVNGQWKPNGKLSGPNEVTSSTATNLTGLLKGNGTNVEAAVPEVDYATPEQTKVFMVTFSENNDGSIIADKSTAEIYSAYMAGKVVVGKLYERVYQLFGMDPMNGPYMRFICCDNNLSMSIIEGGGDYGLTDYDYILTTRPNSLDVLPDSGYELQPNTVYTVYDVVNTYAFKPPWDGWAHGTFTTGTTPNITFTGGIIGKLPDFAANKVYEFDVYNGIWAVQEVVER